MRVAFTIIYNGLHHLKHKGFTEFMLENFDYWAVVEGHSRPGGSTGWCKRLAVPPRSSDGTHEYLQELSKNNPKLLYFSPGQYHFSKDRQVNAALDLLRPHTKDSFLWEVDADEHWTVEKLEASESHAEKSIANGFCFQFNQFVGLNLVAKGEWGGGFLNRLWKWKGEIMRTHEPALLMGQRYVEAIPGILFDHYSYYFKQDVLFKGIYYKGHENVPENWEPLQLESTFPVHISKLFGEGTQIGKTNSYIHEITSTN